MGVGINDVDIWFGVCGRCITLADTAIYVNLHKQRSYANLEGLLEFWGVIARFLLAIATVLTFFSAGYWLLQG